MFNAEAIIYGGLVGIRMEVKSYDNNHNNQVRSTCALRVLFLFTVKFSSQAAEQHAFSPPCWIMNPRDVSTVQI